MEKNFFSIVRWFGLIIATLALSGAVIAFVIGGSKFLIHPNSSFKNPNPKYDDFQQSAEAQRAPRVTPNSSDNTLRDKEAAAAAAAADAEYERKLKPHLDAIVSHLETYAARTDQPKPSSQAVGDRVRSMMKDLQRLTGDTSLSWSFVEGLERATQDLSNDADRLSKLAVDDPRRVRWDRFLEWYARQFNEQIATQLQRREAERLKAIAEAAEAPMYFYAGAVAFGAFILTTVLLLLVKIESNTRPVI